MATNEPHPDHAPGATHRENLAGSESNGHAEPERATLNLTTSDGHNNTTAGVRIRTQTAGSMETDILDDNTASTFWERGKVKDHYDDRRFSQDVYNNYLSMRYLDRKSYLKSRNAEYTALLENEERRIRQLRDRFDTEEKTTHLGRNLSKSRYEWRVTAKARAQDESHIERIDKEGKYSQKPERKEDILELLQRVHIWETDRDPTNANANAPTSTEQHDFKDSGNGFDARVIKFRHGLGGERYYHPKCHGEFPNQKVSVEDLLFDPGSPLTQACEEGTIRHFHLPANNMYWVEVCSPSNSLKIVVDSTDIMLMQADGYRTVL